MKWHLEPYLLQWRWRNSWHAEYTHDYISHFTAPSARRQDPRALGWSDRAVGETGDGNGGFCGQPVMWHGPRTPTRGEKEESTTTGNRRMACCRRGVISHER